MDYVILIAAVTAIALSHLALVGRFQGLLTLDSIFVAAQWTMAVGTLTILEPENAADKTYALVVTAPLLLYVAASIVTNSSLRSGRKRDYSGFTRTVWVYGPSPAVAALFVLAAVVTALYFSAVGYNTFILGIRGMFTGIVADYTTLRLESYSTGRGLYPGYVNQFKNTILPTLAVVLSLYLMAYRAPMRKPLTALLAGLVIISLLGTGQRGAFVLFSMTVLVLLQLIDRRRFPHRARLVALVAVPPLILTTAILGRSSTALEQAAGPLGKLVTLISELVRRFFFDNQFSGQMAFRYTYGQPVQNGTEWMTAVAGVLPSHSGSPLPSQIFYYLYGTYRGTSPPSLWGSTYYNFGWVGLAVLAVGLGIAFQVITYRAINKREVNTFELAGMAGTFVTFGTWIAGGPEYLLNAGALTFAVLWWLGRRAAHIDLQLAPTEQRSPTRQPAPPSRAAVHTGAPVATIGE